MKTKNKTNEMCEHCSLKCIASDCECTCHDELKSKEKGE